MKKVKSIKSKGLAPLLFLFLFSFISICWGTDFVAGSLKINSVDPTGQNYHGNVSVQWSVVNEDAGDQYNVWYGVVGSWSLATIVEGLPYPPGGGAGGSHTYTVTWNTSADIPGNQTDRWIRITKVTGGELIDGSFNVYNGNPGITVVSPDGNESWSGTKTITWSVANPWPDDAYKIQYMYNYPGGTWLDITTTETSPASYTYNWDTTTAIGQPATTYRVRIYGTVSGVGYADQSNGNFTIDQNAISAITVTKPTSTDKCRGTIEIKWSITGTERIDETYNVEYYSTATGWQTIASGLAKGTTSTTWNTTAVADRQYKIKVTAVSSNVSGESSDFIVDNTVPEIVEVKISPENPDGMIPDVDIDFPGDVAGRNGRAILMVKPSGWYVNYPTLSVKVKDPKASDNSYAGIYRVAYKIHSNLDETEPSWQIDSSIPQGSYEGTVNISLAKEGNVVWAEIVVIDDAQYSTVNPPNYNNDIYSAGGGYGNYSLPEPGPYEAKSNMTANATYNAGSNETTFYDNTQSWNNNELVGRKVWILSGVGAGNKYEIVGNNATSFSVSGDHSADGLTGTEYAIDTSVQIDVTPPTINYIKVDKLPDGPWIGTKQWYKNDLDARPLISLDVKDELSGVYSNCCLHTVDGKTINLGTSPTKIPYNGELGATYELKPLEGEIVTFVCDTINDCPGVKRKDGTSLPNGLWFPVYNAYGQKVHARIWDNAGNISAEKVDDPVYIGEVTTSVKLYVDTIPPESTVSISNDWWPNSPLDKGTYAKDYYDIWRHNLNFSRPEDASPPAGYPQSWVDYIYVASNGNLNGLNPARFSISVQDSPYVTVTKSGTDYRRWYEVMLGHPDWEIQYDYFFSDFSSTNSGVGVSTIFNSPWYRYSYSENANLVNINSLWTDGTDVFYVGDKGVIAKWNGTGWSDLVNTDMYDLYGISGKTSSEIYAVGDNATILHYNGTNWTKMSLTHVLGPTIGSRALYDIIYFPSGDVEFCVVGWDGGIFSSSTQTENEVYYSGHSVKDSQGNTVDLTGIDLKGIWGTSYSANELFAVGERGTICIYEGTSGETWLLQENIPVSGDLYDVWGTASNNVFVVGDIEYISGNDSFIGYLYYNGTTWQLRSTGISSTTPNNFSRLPIYGITGSGNNIYMVGARGTIIHSSDGGNTWNLEPIPSSVTGKLYNAAIAGSNVFVVGEAGRTLYYNGAWNTTNLWSDWIQNATGSFTLQPNTTCLEYFAIDDLGNEEVHHKIVDPGKGTVKTTSTGKGKGNIRTDDNVPTPNFSVTPSSPDGENGWYRSPATISITYSNSDDWSDPLSQYLPNIVPGSGIKKFQYAKKTTTDAPSESDFVDYTFGIPFSVSDGEYWFYYRAEDNLGNRSGDGTHLYTAYSGNAIRIDTKNPTTTISFSSGKFTLTASDNLSGVNYTKYIVHYSDGTKSETMTYTAPFSTIAGTNNIEYWSKDFAGNEEVHKTYYVSNLDKTSPVTTISITSGPSYYDSTHSETFITSSKNTNPTHFKVTATDPVVDSFSSGLAINYPKKKLNSDALDGETGWESGIALLDFTVPDTATSIWGYAKDGAGNEETPHKNYPFTIDDIGPVISAISLDPASPSATGWYNSTTGAPKVTVTRTDSGSGVKEIRYTTNGSEPSSSSSLYSDSFSLPDGVINAGNFKFAAWDNLGNKGNTQSYASEIKVDTTSPSTTISFDGAKFTLSASDNVSGVSSTEYCIYYQDKTNTGWKSYTGSAVNVSANVVKVEYRSTDNAGNREDTKTQLFQAYSISGHVVDVNGNGIANVKVSLDSESGNIEAKTTDSTGYYEFTEVDPTIDVYLIPRNGHFSPLKRKSASYTFTNKTEQNFVMYNGWTHINYDKGCTNNYLPSPTTSLPSGSKLIGVFTDSITTETGVSIGLLSGDIDGDGKLELITSDENLLKVYKYNSSTQTYDIKYSGVISGEKLTLLDNVDSDTQLEIFVSTRDENNNLALNIYNYNTLLSTLQLAKTIQKTNSSSAEEWIPRSGQDKIVIGIKEESGSSLNGVSIFDYSSTDEILFETSLNNQVLSPETMPFDDFNQDGLFEIILGGSSDTVNLQEKTLNEEGTNLFTTSFGVKGKITPVLADLNSDGIPEILVFETHNSTNPGVSKIHTLKKTDGSIDKTLSLSTSTNNENLYFAIGDINKDNVAEVVVSDDSGNIYIANMLSGTLITSSSGLGRVWAINNFDGDTTGYKEIIVSLGNTVKVLDRNLNELYSYTTGGTITSCILSDLDGNGTNEIIVASDKLYIIKPATSSDWPTPPSDIEVAIDANGYVIVTWKDNSNNELGFYIYRSTGSSASKESFQSGDWTKIGQTTSNVTYFIDTTVSSGGVYIYKVIAFNDLNLEPTSEEIEDAPTSESVYVPPTTGASTGGGGGGCFIATVVFGSPLDKHIQILKDFRDRFLLTNIIGKKFVSWYYKYGKIAATYITTHSYLKPVVKILLYPIIIFAYLFVSGIIWYLVLLICLGTLTLINLRS